MKTKITKKAWAPVRKNESGEWLDLNCLGSCREIVTEKIDNLRQTIPQWDAANKIVRIIEVTIHESYISENERG